LDAVDEQQFVKSEAYRLIACICLSFSLPMIFSLRVRDTTRYPQRQKKTIDTHTDTRKTTG
jgi:hypothetical protein